MFWLENNQWHIFHILTSEDIDDAIYRFLHWIYIVKRILLLMVKTIVYSFVKYLRATM